MKSKQNLFRVRVLYPALAIMVSVILRVSVAPSVGAGLTTAQEAGRRLAPAERQAIAAFERRVKNYLKLREQAKQKTPKLAKESTPEHL
jgi:CHASE1-domain containing sensor protein